MAHTRAAVLAYPSPEILRIEHSQANPLKLSLAWDPAEEMPSSLTLRAEIHPSRSVADDATPLAAVTLAITDADTQPWTLEFSSQQTNLDLGGRDQKTFVLTISGIETSTRFYTLADADLVLSRHPCSQLVPPAVSPLLYATTEDLDAIDARVTVVEETGGGGGGGGGVTNLTRTLAPTSVTILSDTGTDAVIPAADGTNAGVFPAALHTKLAGIATGATANATDAQLRDRGTHTGTQATSTITGLDDALAAKADLVGGKLATSQLPDLAIQQYLGTAANQSAMLLLVGQRGDWCTRTDDGKVYIVTGEPSSTLGNWTSLSYPTAPVLSVAGRTGAVTLNSSDISGLGALATLAAVGTAQITDGAVTDGKIASNAVTTAKLDAEAVTYAKIQTLAAASTLLGRGTTGGAFVREISIGAGLSMSGDTLSATAGSGDVVGPASSTANAISRFSGTGGKTLLTSAIVIDDIDATTQQNVAIRNVDPATNSAIVITPKGTGAFILGPKPDGLPTGGDARGVRALDLQRSRSFSSQIASNTDSALIGGANNTALGQRSGVFCGESNTASATQSACFAGQQNVASATQAVTLGGTGARANRIGMQAQANGLISNAGDMQRGVLVMRRTTTDATPVQLSLNGAAPTGASITTSTHFILLDNQAVFADIRVVARSTGGTDHAAFMRRVLIKRDANAASTAIIGSVLSPTTDLKSAGATAWDVAITALATATDGGMLVTVTGAATTINWVASVEFVETTRT